MPSSNKTPYLELNRWLGTDKPKRDDFNSDNLKIDQRMQQLDSTLGGQIATIAGQTSGLDRLNDAVEEQATAIADLDTALSAHTDSGERHITPEDRSRWDAGAAGGGGGGGGAPKLFTYTGDGGMYKQVAVGFRPRCGWIFAGGYPLASINVGAGVCELNSLFLSEQGSSSGLIMNDNGFMVLHDAGAGANGSANRLNRSGVTYICALWE